MLLVPEASEAALQRRHRTTKQLRTGRASKQEAGVRKCAMPIWLHRAVSNPFLSWGPDPERCFSKARYCVTAETHRARDCSVQEGPASSGGL